MLGTYQVNGRSQGCVTCPTCQHNPNWGSDNCTDCTFPYVPSAISDSCITCDPGLKRDSGCGCSELDAGYYVNASRDIVMCPAGMYSPSDSTEGCYTCPNGTWRSEEDFNSCQQCDGNTYSILGSQCSPCPNFTVNDGNHAKCVPCSAGQIVIDQNIGTCAKCNASTYSNTITCEFCPEGEIPNNSQDGCTIGCFDPQQYSNGTACMDCPYGYQPNTAQTACVRGCPITYIPPFDSGNHPFILR
jgi:hypothetical protein